MTPNDTAARATKLPERCFGIILGANPGKRIAGIHLNPPRTTHVYETLMELGLSEEALIEVVNGWNSWAGVTVAQRMAMEELVNLNLVAAVAVAV